MCVPIPSVHENRPSPASTRKRREAFSPCSQIQIRRISPPRGRPLRLRARRSLLARTSRRCRSRSLPCSEITLRGRKSEIARFSRTSVCTIGGDSWDYATSGSPASVGLWRIRRRWDRRARKSSGTVHKQCRSAQAGLLSRDQSDGANRAHALCSDPQNRQRRATVSLAQIQYRMLSLSHCGLSRTRTRHTGGTQAGIPSSASPIRCSRHTIPISRPSYSTSNIRCAVADCNADHRSPSAGPACVGSRGVGVMSSSSLSSLG
jgi:hypothetical protein